MPKLSTQINLSHSRKGSVTVIVIGIFVALLAMLGGFLKSATQRQYTTKKLNKVLLAREFATSLATLSCHKLKEKDLKTPDSKLIQALKKPIEEMAAKETQDISASDLKSLFGTLIDDLIKANNDLQKLNYKISWSIDKNDFRPILAAYPREKKGVIRLFVSVNYLAPGSTQKMEEDYLYSIKAKVTSNLVPVLSKFTLYIEDALGTDANSEERFNTLKVDSRGQLKNSSEYKPWILKNGPNKAETNYKSYAEKPIGIVYLGSKDTSGTPKQINLGLSRSWKEPGECSEGFHLLAEGRGDGLYTVEKLDEIYQMNWEIGLADDEDGDAKFWFELIYRGFYNMSKVSSILKLYGAGTGDNVSPTLVLGNVKSRTLCARAYKGNFEGSLEYGPLHFLTEQEMFDDSSGASEDTPSTYEHYCFQPFSGSYKNKYGSPLTFEIYQEKYSSTLWEVPYNRGLLYMATNFQDRHPENSGVIGQTDQLYKFATGSSLDKSAMTAVPEPFNKIYNIDSLTDMNDFLDPKKVFAEEQRYSHIIDLTKSKTTLEKELKRLHLLDEQETNLNLNGWIYIKSSAPLTLPAKSLNITSNGGLVLEKGNISIRGPIISKGGDFILQLMALDGNIEIDTSGNLSVGLTAASKSSGDNGQVKLIGGATGNQITVKGNVAMKQIKSVKDHMARGLKLEYFSPLAALPNNISPTNNEEPLLMYSLGNNAELIE